MSSIPEASVESNSRGFSIPVEPSEPASCHPLALDGRVCERCRRPSGPGRKRGVLETDEVGPRFVATMGRVMNVCGRCAW